VWTRAGAAAILDQMIRPVFAIASLLALCTAARAQAPASAPAGASARRTDGEAPVSSAHGLPLRLSLLAPTDLGGIPSSFTCQDTPEEASRLQSLIQLNAASLPLTRQLTLHSFSRWGCPRTAGAGVGLTYAASLSPRAALVIAAGVAAFPHAARGGWLLRPTVRADIQWTTKDGRPRSVGIDATQVLRSAIKAGAQRRIGASVSGSF